MSGLVVNPEDRFSCDVAHLIQKSRSLAYPFGFGFRKSSLLN